MLIQSEKLIAAIDKLTGIDPAHVDAAALLRSHRLALTKCRERIEADNAWASHQEELTRKAIDTAHALAVRHHDGELSQEAVCAALGAIIDTTQGLIDREALDIINTAYRRLRK